MALSILDPGPPAPERNERAFPFAAADALSFVLGVGATALVLIADNIEVGVVEGFFYCIAGGVAGGLALKWFAGAMSAVEEWSSRLRHLQDNLIYDLKYDEPRRRRLIRRGLLAVGVLLFVVNILPEYRRPFLSAEGHYAWSTASSVLAGLGAVLVIFAFVSKRDGEDF